MLEHGRCGAEHFPADSANRLRSLMHKVDVALKMVFLAECCPTFTTFVRFEFLMHNFYVALKMVFEAKRLITIWTSSMVNVGVDCALVSEQGSLL